MSQMIEAGNGVPNCGNCERELLEILCAIEYDNDKRKLIRQFTRRTEGGMSLIKRSVGVELVFISIASGTYAILKFAVVSAFLRQNAERAK
jgi:hypothetical protein